MHSDERVAHCDVNVGLNSLQPGVLREGKMQAETAHSHSQDGITEKERAGVTCVEVVPLTTRGYVQAVHTVCAS